MRFIFTRSVEILEVVLKRVEGVSLTDAYDTDGRTDEGLRRLLPKMIQVCHALEYAHARHIIHRDIKTDNIMLGQYGEFTYWTGVLPLILRHPWVPMPVPLVPHIISPPK